MIQMFTKFIVTIVLFLQSTQESNGKGLKHYMHEILYFEIVVTFLVLQLFKAAACHILVLV